MIITDTEIEARAGSEFGRGIYIGFWNEAEVSEAMAKGESGN